MYKTTKRLKKMKTKRKIKKMKTKKRGGKIFTMRHLRTLSGKATKEDIVKNILYKNLKPLKEDIKEVMRLSNNLIDIIKKIERTTFEHDLLPESDLNPLTQLTDKKDKLTKIDKDLEEMKKTDININNYSDKIESLLVIIFQVKNLYDESRNDFISYTSNLEIAIGRIDEEIPLDEESLRNRVKIMEEIIKTIYPERHFNNGKEIKQVSLVDTTIPSTIRNLTKIEQAVQGYKTNIAGY
jgi:vacuolar-type H+-ATPase subunit I/STV1